MFYCFELGARDRGECMQRCASHFVVKTSTRQVEVPALSLTTCRMVNGILQNSPDSRGFLGMGFLGASMSSVALCCPSAS